jgi:hypothetical protein
MSQYVAAHKEHSQNLAIYLLFPIKRHGKREFDSFERCCANAI